MEHKGLVLVTAQNRGRPHFLQKWVEPSFREDTVYNLLAHLANPAGDAYNPPYEDGSQLCFAHRVEAWLQDALRNDNSLIFISSRENSRLNQPVRIGKAVLMKKFLIIVLPLNK